MNSGAGAGSTGGGVERAGLVERAGADRERDYYRVTDDGVAYLAGLFDPTDDETTE